MNSELKRGVLNLVRPPPEVVVMLAVMFLFYAAWCSVMGWTLSALGFLGPAGYLIGLLPLVAGLIGISRLHRLSRQGTGLQSLRRLRAYEWMFLLVLMVVLTGAVLHEPFGWDACAYRLPRVQRWLSEGRWSWLNSGDDRMDISALSFEWMIAPQLALLRTDRLLFLNNFLPYVLMPGLCWLASRVVGLRRDWALFLSALLPLGFCFVLQAGGIQNDGLAAFFALTSVVLARSKAADWLPGTWRLGLSLISLALLSGLKLTNVPLAGVLGIWVLWREFKPLCALLRNARWALPVSLVAIICSIIPISLANQLHSGNWSGDPLNRYRHKATNPLTAAAANVIFLLTDAITPDPVSGRLNQWLEGLRADPDSLLSKLSQAHPHLSYLRFPAFGYEGTSGPGSPILIGLPLAVGLSCFRRRRISRRHRKWDCGFLVLTGVAYVAFLSMVAVQLSQRHAAGYYPLLVIGVCGPFGARLRLLPSWWTRMVLLGSGFTVLVSLYLSPIRVICPASLTEMLDARGGSFRLHREAAEEGTVLKDFQGRRIYYVLSWGAIAHRLWEPYHFGEMIEIGSVVATRHPPAGRGLLFVSESGITSRFKMPVAEFLETIGPHRELVRDLVSAGVGRAVETGTLYEVDDLGRIPATDSRRIYPFDEDQR